MGKNKELFQIRKYFDTYLEKEWVFNTKEEAEEFYKIESKQLELDYNNYIYLRIEESDDFEVNSYIQLGKEWN